MARRPVETIIANMSHRLRLLAAGFGLIFALGVVHVGASAATSARISAHLTATSFTPARAGTVKLVYKFSSKSSRFAYVLSRKAGSAWSTVRRVSKRGSFRGSHTMAVSGLFGSRPVVVGEYRVKLSSSVNSVTLRFTVVPPGAVKPEAGSWVFTSLSGPVTGYGGSLNPADSVTATGIFFAVNPDRATVSGFGFAYKWSGPGNEGTVCAGQGTTINQGTAPIANGQFGIPASNAWIWSSPTDYGFRIVGTFDSPTTAHGTAQLSVDILNSYLCQRTGYATTGLFSWTATRQP